MPQPFDPVAARTTLFAALLSAARTHGADKQILEDTDRQPLTYGRLILGSMVLGGRLAARTRRSETVGVLLPNVTGLAVVLFGLNAFGRIPAMLNFSSGVRNLRSAVQTGAMRTILTSRRFVDTAKLTDTVAALADIEHAPGRKVSIVYLEDVRKEIGLKEKISGIIQSKLANRVHRRYALAPDQPAIMLYTSGTEGVPKGVVLTNTNLVSNARQIFAHADGHLGPADTVVNPLPMFHSFGLTAGTLMPLLSGMRLILYPSPLHYREIPKLIADAKATVLFSTDTFLQGYARAAEPGAMATIRFVIAGAEKVKDATRAMYSKAGTKILEGYGATECSPVLACNIPGREKDGTVGALLPGIVSRLEPVDGITVGGRLVVRGPNVMAGYILADQPGVLVPAKDGWHDTGDIVEIDERGLVSIKGRAKRFAKLGGEMVSLAAVEAMVSALWPDSNHVVINVSDPRKGEQLILVTDKVGADRDSLQKHARAQGMPELWVPRTIIPVPQIPVLASGKVDFQATRELLQDTLAGA